MSVVRPKINSLSREVPYLRSTWSIISSFVAASCGRLRTHLQGGRRIPITVGKLLFSFEPIRRLFDAPAGYCSVQTCGKLSDINLSVVGPIEKEEQILLSPAVFAIGKEVQSKLAGARLVADARSVYVLRDGKYRNARGHFELAVLDAKGRLLSELSPDAIGPDFHRIYEQLSLRRERRLSGRVIVLTTPGARDNYFHWCLEMLPKIQLLRSSGLFQPKKDTFMINHKRARYQMETLALLGLDGSNTIRTYPGIKITANELIVPSHSSLHEAVSRWSVEFLRENFGRDNYKIGDMRKFFLDRGSARRRSIVNLVEVREYLSRRGYAIIDTSQLSFKEQVSLFRGARTIISPHGAGLANLCFVEGGTKLLEIFSPFYMPDYFRVLSQHVGAAYSCVSGVARDKGTEVGERQRISHPFEVPLNRLARAVDRLES